jgi:uncharacterized Ntn-hydrolase superfamily protein
VQSTLATLALLAAADARATWSIAAVDPATREVGIAGASCIGNVARIVGIAPAAGAVVSQAFSNEQARDRAVELLRAGAAPQAVIDAVATSRFDGSFGLPLHHLRQYGVAALGFEDRARSFTGAVPRYGMWPWGWAAAAQGHGVAVQGNLLRSPGVVEASLRTFEALGDCPLAERLLAALEAGAAAGGDNRCPPEQTALSAVLVVAPADAPEPADWFRIEQEEPEKGGRNPVAMLRAVFAARRPDARCGYASAQP